MLSFPYYQVVHHGLAYIGWAVYFGFAAYGAGIRIQMRDEFGINGNYKSSFKLNNYILKEALTISVPTLNNIIK